jgi:hypothetical protein
MDIRKPKGRSTIGGETLRGSELEPVPEADLQRESGGTLVSSNYAGAPITEESEEHDKLTKSQRTPLKASNAIGTPGDSN